jgi:hypothetical protein
MAWGQSRWLASGSYAARNITSLQMIGGALLSGSGAFSSLPVTGTYVTLGVQGGTLKGADGSPITLNPLSGTVSANFLSSSFEGVSGSVIQALNYLEAKVTSAAGVDTLGELSDVTIAGVADANVFLYDNAASVWKNKVLSGDATIDKLGEITLADGSDARTNLGLAIGSDVQAFGAVLDDLNTLGAPASDGQFIVGTGAGVFAYESGATARTSLGLAIGTNVQAHGAVLDSINSIGIPASDGQFIVATGGASFAYESGATARGSLGLGSIATQAASSVAITGGTLEGITAYSGSSVVSLGVVAGGPGLHSLTGGDRPIFNLSGTVGRADGTKIQVGTTVSTGADYMNIDAIPHMQVMGTDASGKLNIFKVQVSGGLLQVESQF